MRKTSLFLVVLFNTCLGTFAFGQQPARTHTSFNNAWRFHLGDVPNAQEVNMNDRGWRKLDLPHDWSIELPFDKDSPTGTGGGALRGGLGWYRKIFTMPTSARGKRVAITFDGIYCNSEVWINGRSLGKRPNGYISFQYELSEFLNYGNAINTIAVRVDNSQQPNSRWYSGSGIYRNVWLTVSDKTHITYNGVFITTPVVTDESAIVDARIIVQIPRGLKEMSANTTIYDAQGIKVAYQSSIVRPGPDEHTTFTHLLQVRKPRRWSNELPYLYRAVTRLSVNGKVLDEVSTGIGIRSFTFDIDKGFLLNGKKVKIRGVCMHHDLGCLGTAVDKSALRRQLQLLREMGCNGIRTSHNPPAPELLDLCDEMGFIVMNEAFDMWKKGKTKYDYSLDWDKWHKKDLVDFVERDRNHPSVFMWSVGNEVGEQWGEGNDSSGKKILRELVSIVKSTDPTRPTVTANNEVNPWSRLLNGNPADMIGYNYNHNSWDSVFYRWPRQPFIVTESVSSLTTRGHYDMPSDSIRRWPTRWDVPVQNANHDLTCSAYDNCSAPWGSTHEETLREFEKYDHISGMYIWTGFDYIGEPTPYPWPARSSYFGIIDLAGFPKDVYHMYQSAWTQKPVLHMFPHWNWKRGDEVDVWVYYNQADEVELFLNGKSYGRKRKSGDELHVMWRLPFEPGELKAVSWEKGVERLTRVTRTTSAPVKIILKQDNFTTGPDDLIFVRVSIVDNKGDVVPNADNLIQFDVEGATIAGVDNGSQSSLESFKGNKRKAYNGLSLVVLRPGKTSTGIKLKAISEGLSSSEIFFPTKR
ncbi:MAG: DUF4982 domain-containing protein [Chitinophagaceae bacterium]|nr:DUF4982 domain-containing protein [Chitinophagaceae bacterium]